jgi:hypothetical protein
VLVERVAPDHPSAAGGEGALGGVGARQRDQLVAALDQSRGERGPDQAAAACEENARPVLPSSRATPGRARMK